MSFIHPLGDTIILIPIRHLEIFYNSSPVMNVNEPSVSNVHHIAQENIILGVNGFDRFQLFAKNNTNK